MKTFIALILLFSSVNSLAQEVEKKEKTSEKTYIIEVNSKNFDIIKQGYEMPPRAIGDDCG